MKRFLLTFCTIFGCIIEAFADTIPNNEIWYTSNGGNIITPYTSSVFGANIVSNTYVDGKGIIKFDGSVMSIGYAAFYKRTNLTSVIIPNSVTSIGDYAFCSCTGLTSITIPNSVTSIGSFAFYGCTGLTSVTMGNSVESIGGGAFYGCISLTSVHITDLASWCAIKFNESTSNPLKYAKHLYINDKEVTELIIPQGVTSIGMCAFLGCIGLSSVVIPNTVTSIEYGAFEGCIGLTTITIPNSVTSIGVRTLYECTGLTSVTIPNSVTSIGAFAFFGCTGLTSITVPNSVTSIESGAFEGCSGVQSLCISSGVKSIGKYAFSGLCDKNFKNLVLPDGIEKIYEYAFANCSYLKNVTFSSALEEIGENAFANDDRLLYITCYAEEPPLITENVFPNNDAYLKVPCESKDEYKVAKGWKLFNNISCIGAETTEPTTVVKITSGDNEVTITWPTSENASTYTVEVYSNGELFCTLVFGADGVLNSVIYANGQQRLPGIKGTPEMPQRATLTNGGMQFTITGLDYATNYTYKVVTTDSNGQEIASYSGSFSTNGATGIDDITTPLGENSASKKLFIDGHLYILRDGKTYTVQGAEVR